MPNLGRHMVNNELITPTSKLGNSLPSGVIMMWNGDSTNIPSGWALCDGTNGTPNLVNRFIMASTSSGTTGGQDTVTLTSMNIPAHSHDFTGVAHSHTVNSTTVSGTTNGYTHSHTFYGTSHSHSTNGAFGFAYWSGSNYYYTSFNNNSNHSHTITSGNHYHTISNTTGHLPMLAYSSTQKAYRYYRQYSTSQTPGKYAISSVTRGLYTSTYSTLQRSGMTTYTLSQYVQYNPGALYYIALSYFTTSSINSGGTTGGNTHSHTLNQANHTHTISSNATSSGTLGAITHSHAFTGTAHSHGINNTNAAGSINSLGSSVAYNNKPKYYILCFIMKL